MNKANVSKFHISSSGRCFFRKKSSVICIFDQNIKILGRLQRYIECPATAMKTDLFLECTLPCKTVTYNFNIEILMISYNTMNNA